MENIVSHTASSALVTNPVTIFLVVLGIILIVPTLLQRLKIPYIIGLILAGIAVGPYGFHVLDHDMSFEVFGKVGILYLMFLVGLEIDRYNLEQNMRRGLVFGLFTFFVPLIIGFFTSWLLFGLSLPASTLLASMLSAHTLLAYPIVSRFGLTKSGAVVIAVAGTVFTVLGSLIVVAVVGTTDSTGSFSALALLRLVASIAIFCLAVYFIYPPVTRWFFRRFSEGINQFIYILAMVFLASATSSWIGIESIFGAFFAGLVLNRFVPARSPLMTRIEFVGNAIFIPYFMIGVGMIIDIKVIASGWSTIYFAGIMSVAAIASKWLAAQGAGLLLGLKRTERSLIYQLTNAHTAVALAVVSIGYGMGLFPSTIVNATVIMILVTCTVSSIGTEQASRRMKISQLKQHTGGEKQTGERNTLVMLANPTSVEPLVNLAVMMRGPRRMKGLFAVNVRNDNSPAAIENCRSSLEMAEKIASGADIDLTALERYDNNVVTGVLHTVDERQINEIIIGLHRRVTFVDSFFGSKIEQLITSTNKMLSISRCYVPVNTLRRVMVFVPQKAEYETGFQRWVESVAMLASQIGCPLIFHCHPATERYLRGVIAHGNYGVTLQFIALENDDDFVLLAGTVLDDDLFIAVTARRTSVSFAPILDELPGFLGRYFSNKNIIVIYPEQFGDQPDLDFMTTAMGADYVARPVGWLRRLIRVASRRSRRMARTESQTIQ